MTNLDTPTPEDILNPLLASDDPRTAPAREYQDDDDELPPGSIGYTSTNCPLCGETVQTQFEVTEPKPCETHPGEMHPQVAIDYAPLAAHERVCPILQILDVIFPDVRQDEDDTPD